MPDADTRHAAFPLKVANESENGGAVFWCARYRLPISDQTEQKLPIRIPTATKCFFALHPITDDRKPLVAHWMRGSRTPDGAWYDGQAWEIEPSHWRHLPPPPLESGE